MPYIPRNMTPGNSGKRKPATKDNDAAAEKKSSIFGVTSLSIDKAEVDPAEVYRRLFNKEIQTNEYRELVSTG